MTAIIQISGVNKQGPARDFCDADRGWVDHRDRLGSVRQVAALVAGGFDGPISFEPFAPEIHNAENPEPALAASIAFITEAVLKEAA